MNRQVMVTDLAERYATMIADNKDQFVIGFTDAWHDQPREPLRKDDILHAMNVAYDLGYSIGAHYASAWKALYPNIEEDDE